MEIQVCIGSSCHLKGSRDIVEQLRQLIDENHLERTVQLNGSFCMGKCVEGVCVTVDGTLYSLSKDETKEFFQQQILGRLSE